MATPLPDDLVLVALVTNQTDFARARTEHWYRIPVRHMPHRAAGVPWIAFYQTKAFGAEKWAVNHYAAALSWDVMARRLLLPDQPDHPRAAEDYYRVGLGPLLPVPHPIPSRAWKRVTFLVTHWAQIERAWELSDLLEANALERGLWRALERMRQVREVEDEWEDI